MVEVVSWEGGLAVKVLVFTLVICDGTANAAFFTPPWRERGNRMRMVRRGGKKRKKDERIKEK